MRKRCLFLDRDGVINVDHGYVHRTGDFEFLPSIFDLVRGARALSFEVVVVTNQSGIGRGYFTEETYADLTRWMCRRFEAEGAPLTGVLHAPYLPDAPVEAYRADHDWRKPKPGMILEAGRRFGLDLPRSAILGDGDRDLIAGYRAGLGLLIKLGDTPAAGLPPEAAPRLAADLAGADRIFMDWAAASA